MFKDCLQCSSKIKKRDNESFKYWETKRFCSRLCAIKHVKLNKVVQQKKCAGCASTFDKLDKLSKKQWKEQRFCTRLCASQDAERNSKIGQSSIGNTYAEGMTPWNKGTQGLYTLSEETKKKLSRIHKARVVKGLCHLWKGGITDLNKELRGCKLMRDWKRSVLEKDNFTCQQCGKRGGKLNADHIKEFSLIRDEHKIKTYEEAEKCAELWDVDNGQTLCVPCHKVKTAGFMKLNWSNQFTNKLKIATDTWELI